MKYGLICFSRFTFHASRFTFHVFTHHGSRFTSSRFTFHVSRVIHPPPAPPCTRSAAPCRARPSPVAPPRRGDRGRPRRAGASSRRRRPAPRDRIPRERAAPLPPPLAVRSDTPLTGSTLRGTRTARRRRRS